MKRALFILTFVILCAAGAPDAPAADNEDFVTALTEENIRAFLEESRSLSVGRDIAMMEEDLAGYFHNHLAEKGTFKTRTRYELPGFPVQEGEMSLTKEEYINFILQGQNLMADYSAAIEIKTLEISGTGRSATIQTTTVERGLLPWPDAQGNRKQIPIEGTSDCEQKLIVSLNNYIQMAQADCATLITFSPFGDEPLGE